MPAETIGRGRATGAEGCHAEGVYAEGEAAYAEGGNFFMMLDTTAEWADVSVVVAGVVAGGTTFALGVGAGIGLGGVRKSKEGTGAGVVGVGVGVGV